MIEKYYSAALPPESLYANDLWLWKAEAHFQLDENEKGKIVAESLLRYLDTKSPFYEIAFRLARS